MVGNRLGYITYVLQAGAFLAGTLIVVLTWPFEKKCILGCLYCNKCLLGYFYCKSKTSNKTIALTKPLQELHPIHI